MKSTKALIVLAIAVTGLTIKAQAHGDSEMVTHDIGIEKCFSVFKNVSLENSPSRTAAEFELGRAIGRCLYAEGYTQKSNLDLNSAHIIRYLGSMSAESLDVFDAEIKYLLKRP